MAPRPDDEETNMEVAAPTMKSRLSLLQSKICDLNEEITRHFEGKFGNYSNAPLDRENSSPIKSASDGISHEHIEENDCCKSPVNLSERTIQDAVKVQAKHTLANNQLQAKVESLLTQSTPPPAVLPSCSVIQSITDLHDSNVNFRFQTVSRLNEIVATHQSVGEVSHSIDSLRQQILESELNHQLELALMGQKASALEREIFDCMKADGEAYAETDRLIAELKQVWPADHYVNPSKRKSYDERVSLGEEIEQENSSKEKQLNISMDTRSTGFESPEHR
ncbi:GTP-binding protein HflX [Perkinsela sp. CCAP 1560/4]|nr:GTP-binding protein HflX [Perkinsela sp. CCAP 1560/4]|eukprot:KNH04950.1 GTP-binding protein HflX [Perkinsela sp. CCAP 1560/4]